MGKTYERAYPVSAARPVEPRGQVGQCPHFRRRSIMQVRDVMTHDVRCIAPSNTLQEAAEKMKRLDVGPMPVCENKRLKGILTDRDIVLRAVAEGLDPKEAQ